MRQLLIIICLLIGSICQMNSQTRVGDFIESVSYNQDKRNAVRTLQYWVDDDGAYVCHNGNNRYTRALYGGNTEFRLETSDRPIFATYKKRDTHNISFTLVADNLNLPLKEAQSCTSRYKSGLRTYHVKDDIFGANEYIDITVVASSTKESVIWRIETSKNVKANIALKVDIRDIRVPKLHRSGDIGADVPGCFDSDTTKEPTFTAIFPLTATTPLYLSFSTDSNTVVNSVSNKDEFEQAVEAMEALTSRVRFTTPDSWLNAMDEAILCAADGTWDGETWLHGAIGWRMQLAGWRAAYTADALGWDDRAESHFSAYAESQVTNIEPTLSHPSQDADQNMARAKKEWGTQMYSNGYICRNPHKASTMHHYDMNLNYIDELLTHFCYDAREETLRKYWPLLKRHLEWEKRNFDPDDDGLYDAYCCIWASDALYYSGGAVTHSSAYMLRALRMAAEIAERLGEDGTYYKSEANKTATAIEKRLWVENKDGISGHWAEYQDLMGEKMVHPDAALWTIYTCVDCGVGTPEQRQSATRYIDEKLPHIEVAYEGDMHGLVEDGERLYSLSTTNWLPYSWSINNVAGAEVLNTALAYFEAGRPDRGYALLKANTLDNMLLGSSPANFGQLSFLDAARGECYRDFADVVGVASKCLMQGLWGIRPDALHGRCEIVPGFPASWDEAEVVSPYLSYSFKREGDDCIFKIKQNFKEPLTINVKMLGADGYVTAVGNNNEEQVLHLHCPARTPEKVEPKDHAIQQAHQINLSYIYRNVEITKHFNDSVTNIFRHDYLSPRPAVTTLQIPRQGIGEWCHPKLTADICDSAFRAAKDGKIEITNGLTFTTPKEGNNILFVSRWDNFPTETTIPLAGRGKVLKLLMAGSTNHMQCHVVNGLIIASYTDGSADTLQLIPPENWAPIEQDYYVDGRAFKINGAKPLRVSLKTGEVGRELTHSPNEVYGREIEGGGAIVVEMSLNPKKRLKSLTLKAVANDVIIGLMAAQIGE